MTDQPKCPFCQKDLHIQMLDLPDGSCTVTADCADRQECLRMAFVASGRNAAMRKIKSMVSGVCISDELIGRIVDALNSSGRYSVHHTDCTSYVSENRDCSCGLVGDSWENDQLLIALESIRAAKGGA